MALFLPAPLLGEVTVVVVACMVTKAAVLLIYRAENHAEKPEQYLTARSQAFYSILSYHTFLSLNQVDKTLVQLSLKKRNSRMVRGCVLVFTMRVLSMCFLCVSVCFAIPLFPDVFCTPAHGGI